MLPVPYSMYLPYRAYTFGSTPNASRIMIGVCGLCFFIVGYVRVRNDLLDSSISEVLAIDTARS